MRLGRAEITTACSQPAGDRQPSRRGPRAVLVLGALVGIVELLACVSTTSGLDTLDARRLGIERQREVATRQLEQARKTVAQARSAAAIAKRDLDVFVEQHFDDLRVDATAPPREPQKPSTPAKIAPDPQVAYLNRELSDLMTRRKRLLERYTAAHPEVTGIEAQITEFSARLAALEKAKGAEDLSAPTPNNAGVANPAPVEPTKADRQRRESAAALYGQLTRRWQAAEHELQLALEVEEQAAKQLAAIELPASTTPTSPTTSARNAGRTETPASGTPERGSQPLALAALLIALAVAALAAVKLARASSDSLFASAEDVAAALALPVVGIFPAAESVGPAYGAVRLARGSVVLAEIVLAIAVFALIVYCVQNPASLWEVFTHPIESLGGVSRRLVGY